ncbi:hypothetical protein KR215_005812, partial [Drosophila sulfurigaster]
SLEVIRAARDFGLVTKSNLILGMGETADEVRSSLTDLKDAGCDIVTITQYLRPTSMHHPIERWVKPEEFIEHSDFARELGFGAVMSGPLVRSSYRSGRLYAEAKAARGEALPENLTHLGDNLGSSTSQEAGTLLEKYGPSKETPTRGQMWQAFQLQRKRDKKLVPYMLLGFLVPVAVLLLLSLLFGAWWFNLIIGILIGAVVAMVIFSRRLQSGVYDQIEGQAGAAAWALTNLRSGVGMK